MYCKAPGVPWNASKHSRMRNCHQNDPVYSLPCASPAAAWQPSDFCRKATPYIVLFIECNVHGVEYFSTLQKAPRNQLQLQATSLFGATSSYRHIRSSESVPAQAVLAAPWNPALEFQRFVRFVESMYPMRHETSMRKPSFCIVYLRWCNAEDLSASLTRYAEDLSASHTGDISATPLKV